MSDKIKTKSLKVLNIHNFCTKWGKQLESWVKTDRNVNTFICVFVYNIVWVYHNENGLSTDKMWV